MKSFILSAFVGFAATAEISSLYPEYHNYSEYHMLTQGDGPDIWGLTTVEYNEMLAGIVYGVIDQNKASEICDCLSGVEHLAVEAYQGLHTIRQGGVDNFEAGILMIKDVVTQLPVQLKGCGGAVADDGAKLAAWGEGIAAVPQGEFQSWILSNINSHKLKLTTKLAKAKLDFAQEEFFHFGEDLGNMLVLATTP